MSTRPNARADRDYYARYVVPTVLLVAVMLALFELPDPFQLLLPLVAFGCGFLFRPRRTWVIWPAAWALFVVTGCVMLALGYEPPKAVQQVQVTVLGFILESPLYALYLAALALAPLWLGRYVAKRLSARTSSSR